MGRLDVARARLRDTGSIWQARPEILTAIPIPDAHIAARRLVLQVIEIVGALSIALDEIENLHARIDQLERLAR